MTGSLWPESLCAASPSTLLFVDVSNKPWDVYWLDCSGTDPKLTGKKISTELNHINDICHIPDKNKPLLVATDCLSSSLHAYNAVNNKLEWNCELKGEYVTTDGYEYVLVRTGNGIHMLSLLDGKDLGCLMRHGDQGLGVIFDVQWCNTTSLLIHIVKHDYHISTIRFE